MSANRCRFACVLCATVAAAESHALSDPLDPTAAPAPTAIGDAANPFAELSLAELMDVTVTSVTGVAQDSFQTPAAIYVITPEQLKRTGHLFLPEALRLVPGMTVGQVGPGYWAVSSRGFAERFANKLQVLVDGRSIYDPLFAGTTWETQDILLAPDDLERIEVIRGPGATLWGSNAVNGVINVTSKPARETQGLSVTGGAGNPVSAFGQVRYGGQLGDDTHYRVWGKYFEIDNFETAAGDSTFDDLEMPRGGFRLDKEPDEETRLTLQGEAYTSSDIGFARRFLDPTVPFDNSVLTRDVHASGGHLLGRVARETDAGGWTLQAYVDLLTYDFNTGFDVDRQSADIDWRHHSWLNDRNEIVWGLGYRYHHIETSPDRVMTLDDEVDLHTATFFVQDTVTLSPDRVFLMVGSKFEHNEVTGFEVQPNARLWWTPSDRHTVWGSVSRAVRVPAPMETDLSFLAAVLDQGVLMGGPPNGVPVPILATGNSDLESEELIAYEAGYRVKPTDEVIVNVAAFVNDYDNVISLVESAMQMQNTEGTTAYGVEVSTTWRIAANWSVGASYSFIEFDGAGHAPKHQAQLRSSYEVTPDVGLHGAVYFVDEDNYEGIAIDEYVRLDLGLTWRARENVEFSLWGQNLLDPAHTEAAETVLSAYVAEVPRCIYGQVTIRF